MINLSVLNLKKTYRISLMHVLYFVCKKMYKPGMPQANYRNKFSKQKQWVNNLTWVVGDCADRFFFSFKP